MQLDPTRTNDVYFWLACVHPSLMAVGMLLGLLALRDGLDMRTLRRRRGKPSGGPPNSHKARRRRHLRFAKPAMWLLFFGAMLGPLSAVWLRHWRLFNTAHGWLSLAVMTAFAATWLFGWRLEHGRGRPVDAHGLLGMLAMLFGVAAVLTGIELLP